MLVISSVLVSVVIPLLQFVMSFLLVEHLPLVDKLSLEVGMVGIGLGMVGKSRLDVWRLLHWVHNNNKTRQLR